MPRAFTDTEKQTIQERLLQVGRERFARYGLRKTNVEELARAAGISKGAFYLFYGSKEELYFDVLSQVEAEIQAGLLEAVRNSEEASRVSFKRFLVTALSVLKTHPFFANANSEDYQHLLRSMPPEQLQEAARKDEAFVSDLLSAWAEKRVFVRYEPRVVSAALRALVFISLHHDNFEPDVYPQVMDLLVDSLAERLVHDIKNEKE